MAVPRIEFADDADSTQKLTSLPFPPLKVSHVLNCSYHSWYSRYRSLTPKARLVALTRPFLEYLRSDGIILPPDDNEVQQDWSDNDSGIFSSTENPNGAANDSGDDDDGDEDPSTLWREVHESIKSTIAELDGKVVPKLNWSAPKDATWISATNSMECRSANDIYLLLKSSDFVTHDLEHAFDGCVDDETLSPLTSEAEKSALDSINWHLILRKYVQLNPSLEFRVFVRNRAIIGICQRDLNHFDFLFKLQYRLQRRIEVFFDAKLRDTFPDESFVFDVYIPPPHEKVWLIDVNPWAIRTDPLLFSWMELLTMSGPENDRVRTPTRIYFKTSESMPKTSNGDEVTEGSTVRFMEDAKSTSNGSEGLKTPSVVDSGSGSDSDSDSGDDEEDIFTPEFRLIRRDDPEAYGFTTPQYSAHKLPRDVVDASRGGESSLREFAEQWKVVQAERERQNQQADDSEAD